MTNNFLCLLSIKRIFKLLNVYTKLGKSLPVNDYIQFGSHLGGLQVLGDSPPPQKKCVGPGVNSGLKACSLHMNWTSVDRVPCAAECFKLSRFCRLFPLPFSVIDLFCVSCFMFPYFYCLFT